MLKTRSRTPVLPSFPAIKGECLGYRTYRGFAPLQDLAQISKADIFDQDTNRLGTQRNLSKQHARKAYAYVSEKERAFYPELIFNIRDRSFIRFRRRSTEGVVSFGTLEFLKDPRKGKGIVVSRMDGNHRLWYVDGHEKDKDPVDRAASFCFLVIPKLKEELELFRDINDNQMGMNTSHLQNITARLLGEKALKVDNPALYIVQQLQGDRRSPLFKRIHEGGQVKKGATLTGLTVANLVGAVRDMLTRSVKLSEFADADTQYAVIRNYWLAVRRWMPAAWDNPREYLIFKGVGLYTVSYLGIDIIDRCLLKGKYEAKDMLGYLRKISKPELLTAKGRSTYAGRAGARMLANELIADLAEEGEVSVSKLERMILGSS